MNDFCWSTLFVLDEVLLEVGDELLGLILEVSLIFPGVAWNENAWINTLNVLWNVEVESWEDLEFSLFKRAVMDTV